MFGFLKRETRNSVPGETVSLSIDEFLDQIMALESKAAVHVTTDKALGVPAIWSAVNFLSDTIASLPLDVYKRGPKGAKIVVGGLSDIIGTAINDETTSFIWRQHKFSQVFTGGRGLSFIERNTAGRVKNLWPLDPNNTTIKRIKGRKEYHYRDGGRPQLYSATDVLDLTFTLRANGLKHRSPIHTNRDVIGLAIAATDYGSRYFRNGGVPPFAVVGGFNSGKAADRASKDFEIVVQRASAEGRSAIILPKGLDIKALGSDAKNAMLLELKKFCVEEIARIYSLSPIFLQDLSRGTFSNTEQQDLQFTKHTLRHWVKQFEQELNLKLFGRNNKVYFVKLNMDGLLRGDFKTRMEGYARGVQAGVFVPNEARERENLPSMPEGDKLMIQSGTMPIADLPSNEDSDDDKEDKRD